MDASAGAARRLIELSESEDLGISLRATDSVLDRAIGKPAVTITGADGGAIKHEHSLTGRAMEIAEEIGAALTGGDDDGA